MAKFPRHTRTTACIGSGFGNQNALYSDMSEQAATTLGAAAALTWEDTVHG